MRSSYKSEEALLRFEYNFCRVSLYLYLNMLAYRYIRMYKGVAFVEQNYGIIHTLDFDKAGWRNLHVC